MGEMTGKVEDRSTATNPTTKVAKRFTEIGRHAVNISRYPIR